MVSIPAMTPGERLRVLNELVTSGFLVETLKDLAIVCDSKVHDAKKIDDPHIRWKQDDRWFTNRISLEAVVEIIEGNEERASQLKSG